MSEAVSAAPAPRRWLWIVLWLLGLAALPLIWLYVDPYTPQIQGGLHHNRAFMAALLVIKPLGKTGTQLILALACCAVGLLLRRRRVLTWFVLVVLCVAATGLVALVTKVSVRRERPKYEFHLVPTEGLSREAQSNRYRSFPSADTASVFAIAGATVPFAPAAAVAIALVGCLVGLGRVAVGMHHPADAWGAMLMAAAVCWFVLRAWRRREARRAASAESLAGAERDGP